MLQVLGFRLQASGFRFQASGFRLEASGFRASVDMISAMYFGRIQHFNKSIGQHYWSALKRQFQDYCAESVCYHFPSFSCSLGLFLGRFPCSAAPPRCNVPVQRALYNGASTGPESLRAIVTAERLSVSRSVR